MLLQHSGSTGHRYVITTLRECRSQVCYYCTLGVTVTGMSLQLWEYRTQARYYYTLGVPVTGILLHSGSAGDRYITTLMECKSQACYYHTPRVHVTGMLLIHSGGAGHRYILLHSGMPATGILLHSGSASNRYAITTLWECWS